MLFCLQIIFLRLILKRNLVLELRINKSNTLEYLKIKNYVRIKKYNKIVKN